LGFVGSFTEPDVVVNFSLNHIPQKGPVTKERWLRFIEHINFE